MIDYNHVSRSPEHKYLKIQIQEGYFTPYHDNLSNPPFKQTEWIGEWLITQDELDGLIYLLKEKAKYENKN